MRAALGFGFAFVLCFAGSVTCFAQQPSAAASSATISSELDKQLSLIEEQVVGAADAMPEDKYSFVPANGEFKTVRNFGDQVKHIAGANYFFYSSVLGTPPPARDAAAAYTTKAQIMQYLRDSFALGHKAIASITPDNALLPLQSRLPFKTRFAIAAWASTHAYDIYGQMVEYLRMNGIVPPASRQRTE
jgi:DinB superfamily